MRIEAIATDGGGLSPTSGEQWVILMPDGRLVLDGDQSWVSSGRAADSYPGGTLLRRTVTVTYGPWRDAATSNAETELASVREAHARHAAVVAELGHQLQCAARRVTGGSPQPGDVALLLATAERMIGMKTDPETRTA